MPSHNIDNLTLWFWAWNNTPKPREWADWENEENMIENALQEFKKLKENYINSKY